MPMNDPLGDLLARIRNAQMRNKGKVTCPSSRLRESVLEVLKTEGYIRGYSVTEREGRAELDIELKYFDGEPVIRRDRAHFQARPPGLHLGQEIAAHQ